jgi:hypothetical protein
VMKLLERWKNERNYNKTITKRSDDMRKYIEFIAVILVFIGAAVLSVYLISKVFLKLLVFICWAVILV